MAASATVSVEQKVENLRAMIVRLARSNPSILPNTKILEQRFLKLPLFRTPDHPTYASMILTAIANLNEEGGSSEEAISEFIESQYKDLPLAHTCLLSHHLGKLIEKREILCDSKNCYMLRRENNISLGEPEQERKKIKLRQSECASKMSERCEAEREDWIEQEQDLTTEVEFHQEGEEDNAVSSYEEVHVENRDQSQGEHDLTTETEIHSEGEERAAIFHPEKFVGQDLLQNCELEEHGKQKQEAGYGQRQEEWKVEHAEELIGAFRDGVRGFKDKTHEDIVTIDCEAEEGGTVKEVNAGVTLEENETRGEIEMHHEEDESRKKHNQKDETHEVNEVNHRGEKLAGVISDQGETELPREGDKMKEALEQVTLKRNDVEEVMEVIGQEEQSQKKRDQEEERHRVNKEEVLEKQADEMVVELNDRQEPERERIEGKYQQSNNLEAQTLQETLNKATAKQCEPPIAQLVEVSEGHKRLQEQQNEACHSIDALKKMLEEFTKNQDGNEADLTISSSSGRLQKPGRFGSLPLSKESCIELLNSVHKIGGKLSEIINSFDKIKDPNYKSLEHEVEGIRTESVESQMEAKSLYKRKESETVSRSKQLGQKQREIRCQQKQPIHSTSLKRIPEVEITTLGASFRKDKQAKVCDEQGISKSHLEPLLVVSKDVPHVSLVDNRMKTWCQRTEAIVSTKENVDIGEDTAVSVEAVLLEKENQPEKSSLEGSSSKFQAADISQQKHTPLQFEPDPTIVASFVLALPSVTDPKCRPQSKHRESHEVLSREEAEEFSELDRQFSCSDQRKQPYDLDSSQHELCMDKTDSEPANLLTQSHLNDHNQCRQKKSQLWSRGRPPKRKQNSEPEISIQLGSQEVDECDKIKGDDHDDPSQGSLSTERTEAKSSLQHKRKGRPPKKKENSDATENAETLSAHQSIHKKQGRGRTPKHKPGANANKDLSTTSSQKSQDEAHEISKPHRGSGEERFTRSMAAALSVPVRTSTRARAAGALGGLTNQKSQYWHP